MNVVGAKLDDSDYERFETFCMDKSISKNEIKFRFRNKDVTEKRLDGFTT